MYCPNCGENRNIDNAPEHPDAFVERGEYNNHRGEFELEHGAMVLMCGDCQQEFIMI